MKTLLLLALVAAEPEPIKKVEVPGYVSITAADLFAMYTANKFAVNEMALDKPVAITGMISHIDVGTSGLNTQVVLVYLCGVPVREGRPSLNANAIEFNFTKHLDWVKTMVPRQIVTICGTYYGSRSYGGPAIVDCHPIPPPRPKALPKPKPKPKPPKYVPRSWTDTTGKFSVVATFAGYANGQVRLRIEGKEEPVLVPLEKLSEKDRKYFSELQKAANKTTAVTIPFDEETQKAIYVVIHTTMRADIVSRQAEASQSGERYDRIPEDEVAKTVAIPTLISNSQRDVAPEWAKDITSEQALAIWKKGPRMGWYEFAEKFLVELAESKGGSYYARKRPK